jgi:hypothetical protein
MLNVPRSYWTSRFTADSGTAVTRNIRRRPRNARPRAPIASNDSTDLISSVSTPPAITNSMAGRVEEPDRVGPRRRMLDTVVATALHPDQDEAVLGDALGVVRQELVETETIADSAHAESVAEG